MKLLLDQGLPRTAASLLSQAGLGALHVGTIEMSEAKDAEIIEKASAEDRVVVTLDTDFYTLLALNAATSPSVNRVHLPHFSSPAGRLCLSVLAQGDDNGSGQPININLADYPPSLQAQILA